MDTYICVYKYLHVHVCIYIYTYTHTHSNTHTHTNTKRHRKHNRRASVAVGAVNISPELYEFATHCRKALKCCVMQWIPPPPVTCVLVTNSHVRYEFVTHLHVRYEFVTHSHVRYKSATYCCKALKDCVMEWIPPYQSPSGWWLINMSDMSSWRIHMSDMSSWHPFARPLNACLM